MTHSAGTSGCSGCVGSGYTHTLSCRTGKEEVRGGGFEGGGTSCQASRGTAAVRWTSPLPLRGEPYGV